MRHFLLIYDTLSGQLEDVRDLGSDAACAAKSYSDCESEFRERARYEIVLIGARSLETIRRTHSQYFDPDPSAPYAVLLDVV